ncbi:MAG TPA: beta-N-acetylhexosaminidase [Stellaceae bacterium]|nr:beta-N-acetylhexosaminidase [Stellaceae bacterium]
MPDSKIPLAAVFGCAGERLNPAERDFFAAADPLGFILFKRNCKEPAQVARLVAELRGSVRRDDAPVLIDQEGGRVARLGPPHWAAYPPPARIAALGGDAAATTARASARLIADDLARLGITVDCFPLLDLGLPGADAVIGDRAWSGDPDIVSRLGRAACEGLLQGQIMPVIKHIPGHGRATVDSHRALPRVAASRDLLERTDFAPFRALRDMPWAMTAHVVYEAIDRELPATLSPRVIGEAIRGSIGFDGVLISDDISMGALSGDFAARTSAVLAAGCDLVLHCNGDFGEMREVAGAARPLSEVSRHRLATAASRLQAPMPFDRAAAEAAFRPLFAVA